MKEIIEFLKQRRNLKYSLWMIIFGLIFAFSFQVNRAQISQILEKPIRIIPGTKEAEQYLISGWQGAWAKGKRSILRVSLPEEKKYQMMIKAFSCSPPDIRDQRMEVHFNNVALDRLKFRKTSKWQKFSVDIPSCFVKETNAIKFIHTQDTSLSPIAFDSLEFKNYVFRTKGLYLLLDSYRGRTNYLTSRTVGYSFGFAILLWFFWLFYSRFLFRLIGGPALRRHSFGASATGEAGLKIKFSRAIRIDFLSYLPSIIFFSALALASFFSSYHFVYSFKTFIVLALAPTAVLKLFPYKDLFLHFVKIVFRFILRDIEKTCSEIKRVYSACLSFFSFLRRQIATLRKFLIRYHKTNLSSAFILDFMLLLILSAFLLMTEKKIFHWGGEQVAIFAYWLLVIGVMMKFIQLTQKEKTGDEKSFIRIFIRMKNRWKVPFKKIILGLVSILLVSLFLWLILPGKGVEVTRLIPQETFAFLSLKINSEDPGASELINNFDWRIRWGARLLGPVEIAALAVPAVSKEEPDYLFLVKNNRLIKIARLLRRAIDKAMISEKPFKKSKYKTCQILHVERPKHPNNVSSYTLFRDIALFSNNPSLLKASLDQSGREVSFISGEALSDFRELQSSGAALFFINNSHFKLSRALKSLEEKSAYAILPTVGSLNYLGGYFNILDADSLKGSLRFKYREKVDIKKGQGDIYFLAGLVKRLCKVNKLNFEDEIIMDGHYLRLNFKLSGLKLLVSNLLAKGKK